MRFSVSIDCCSWNYLFEHQLDLATALPRERFALTITREVEIEIAAIPDTGKDGSDKLSLKAYIANSIASNQIKTTSIFGFASLEPDGSLSLVQVYGGFDQGAWQSDADRDWYALKEVQGQLVGKKIRPSGLAGNQADAAVAVRSFDSIVLTNECKTKSGPIKLAAEKKGKVVYLKDFELSGISLADYVSQAASSERNSGTLPAHIPPATATTSSATCVGSDSRNKEPDS